MKGLKKQRLVGFTLLELMVVVAIIGLLASIAIPRFRNYIRKSKTTEAYTNLRKIYDGELAYYQDEHVDASGRTLSKGFVHCPWEPPLPPRKDKRPAFFEKNNWPLIKFASDSPLQYSYTVDIEPPPEPPPGPRPPELPLVLLPPPGTRAAFAVAVAGDLDEDGIWSYFERACLIDSDGRIDASSGVFTLDPLE